MPAAYLAAAARPAACMDRPGLARRAGGMSRGRQRLSSMQESSYPPSLPSSVRPSSVVRSLGASACLPSSSVAEVQRAADERSADRRVSYLRVALVATMAAEEDDTAAAGRPLSAGEEAAN